MVLDAVREVVEGGYECCIGKSKIFKRNGCYVVKQGKIEKQFDDISKAIVHFQELEKIKQ